MDNTVFDAETWLKSLENDLKQRGYRRFVQNFKSEDFAYWKTFYSNDSKIYQVGLLFYDFRKFQDRLMYGYNPISITYNCLLIGDHRVELTVSKQTITIEEFEQMAKGFYIALTPFFPSIQPVEGQD